MMLYRPMILRQKLYDRLGRTDQARQVGAAMEVTFWRDFLAHQGRPHYPDQYALRMDLDAPLQDYVRHHLDCSLPAPLILDVGAGPLTSLGKQVAGCKVTITAVDPLAEEYARLLEHYQIRPPVRTIYGAAERLLDIFAPNTFDLAHASNSLDHSSDPLQAIRQMLAVVRPGRSVVLRHLVNEGRQELYVGFHQWNFYMVGEQAYIGNRTKVANLAETFAHTAEVSANIDPPGKITVVLRKYPDTVHP
jgi:SAM-dependent methyltransferase